MHFEKIIYNQQCSFHITVNCWRNMPKPILTQNIQSHAFNFASRMENGVEVELRCERRSKMQCRMPNAHHLHSEEPERDETMRWKVSDHESWSCFTYTTATYKQCKDEERKDAQRIWCELDCDLWSWDESEMCLTNFFHYQFFVSLSTNWLYDLKCLILW